MPKAMVVQSANGLERRIDMAQENLATQITAMQKIRAQIGVAEKEIATHPSRYQNVCFAYDRQYEAVCKAEEALERLVSLDHDESYWSDRSRELCDSLMEEYGGRGPQYEVLIKRLVFAEIAVEQLERSSRSYNTAEGRSANKSVLDAVQALQKYTESQKSEQIRTAEQKAMLVIMEVAEGVIAPKYPEAWARIMEEIERRLPAGGGDE